MSIVCLRMEDRFYIRVSIIVIGSRNFFYLFIYLLPIECQATYFKNSSCIFSTWERVWVNNRNVCSSQGGYLVSIETEEEWQFIN